MEPQEQVFTNSVSSRGSHSRSSVRSHGSYFGGMEFDSHNQVCLTTDNGANIVKAARDLGWVQLACFRHNLHLAVTKSLNRDDRSTRALGLCHKVVSAFSMSWKRRRELTKFQLTLRTSQKALVGVSYTLLILQYIVHS